MTGDNSLYEYSLSQSYDEPDIYFDEKKQTENRRENIGDTKIIISLFLDASKGNPIKLVALLSLFAGGTLREAAEISGKSHEYIRLKLEEIKDTHSSLYHILKNNKNYVDSIMPYKIEHKYTSFDKLSQKYKNFDNLVKFCKDKKLKYNYVKDAICHSKDYMVEIQNLIIKRNYKRNERT